MPAVERLYIHAVGLLTSIGNTLNLVQAAAKAGVSRFSQSSFYQQNFHPITMAHVPEGALPPLADGLKNQAALTVRQAKILRMTSSALQQLLGGYPSNSPILMYVATTPDQVTPEQTVTRSPPFSSDFIAAAPNNFFTDLSTQTGLPIDRQHSRLFFAGRAGVMAAIAAAFAHLATSDSQYIVVGGVDSYADANRLLFLAAQDRVKTEHAMDSFIPGEGAGFLLLSKNSPATMDTELNAVYLSNPGLASEPGHLSSEQPNLGEGLAEAITLALQSTQAKAGSIETIYASMNGENYWAKEFGVAMLRNKNYWHDTLTIEHPADVYGDLGAATGAVMIGLAYAQLNQYQRPASFLVYCSGDEGERGALRINTDALPNVS